MKFQLKRSKQYIEKRAEKQPKRCKDTLMKMKTAQSKLSRIHMSEIGGVISLKIFQSVLS